MICAGRRFWCELTLWGDPDFMGAPGQAPVVGVQAGHVTRAVTPGRRALDVLLIRARGIYSKHAHTHKNTHTMDPQCVVS